MGRSSSVCNASRRAAAFLGALVVSGLAAAAPPAGGSAQIERYRQAMAGVSDCGAFRERFRELPPANGLLASLFSSPPVKDEFEDTQAFEDRKRRYVQSTIGDDRRIYIRAPISLSDLTYDADSGLMTVELQERYIGKRKKFRLASVDEPEGKYIGQNAFGTKVTVTQSTTRNLEVALAASRDFLPDLHIPMSVGDARDAKLGHSNFVHILGEGADFATEDHHISATVRSPYEQTYVNHIVTIFPRCVYVSIGGEVTSNWSYSEPPQK